MAGYAFAAQVTSETGPLGKQGVIQTPKEDPGSTKSVTHQLKGLRPIPDSRAAQAARNTNRKSMSPLTTGKTEPGSHVPTGERPEGRASVDRRLSWDVTEVSQARLLRLFG